MPRRAAQRALDLVQGERDPFAVGALVPIGHLGDPDDEVVEHIATGRLVSVLDDWSQTFPGYHAYYPTRSASPALGLVVEALRQESAKSSNWALSSTV